MRQISDWLVVPHVSQKRYLNELRAARASAADQWMDFLSVFWRVYETWSKTDSSPLILPPRTKPAEEQLETSTRLRKTDLDDFIINEVNMALNKSKRQNIASY